MAIGDKLRAALPKALKPFSSSVTFRRKVPGTYNATTGTISETTTDSTVNGVVSDVTLKEVDSLVKATDKRLTVAGASLANVPTLSDQFVINSVAYQIIRITNDEANNAIISYEFILRG